MSESKLESQPYDVGLYQSGYCGTLLYTNIVMANFHVSVA